MERIEVLPWIFRDAQGSIREIPYPNKEPDQSELSADFYAPSYTVAKGLLAPARVTQLEVVIFLRGGSRRDPDLEREASERLLRAIVAKEGAETVQASGGLETLRRQIDIGPWWAEKT